MNLNLKRGDPCRLRLSGGEIINAVYWRPSLMRKHTHVIESGGESYWAVGYRCSNADYGRFLFPVELMPNYKGPNTWPPKENSNV